jgi:hypothetical protein
LEYVVKISLGHGYHAVWSGGHYVHFYDANGIGYDLCSFAWEKDYPTFMDAWNAFCNYEMEQGL